METWQIAAHDEYVGSWLGDRATTILDHGSELTNRALPWWERHLDAAGMGHISLSPDPTGQGDTRLTRGGLFALAASPGCRDTDEGMLTLLWHVVWWGSGSKHSRIAEKIHSFADAGERAQHLSLLKEAIAAADAGSLEDAYRLLRPRTHAAIPGLGPSYFSKFLYFATFGEGALIIDSRVTKTLLTVHKPGTLRRTSSWSAPEYAEYCQTLAEWASALTAAQRPCAPDEVERALFEGKARPGVDVEPLAVHALDELSPGQLGVTSTPRQTWIWARDAAECAHVREVIERDKDAHWEPATRYGDIVDNVSNVDIGWDAQAAREALAAAGFKLVRIHDPQRARTWD